MAPAPTVKEETFREVVEASGLTVEWSDRLRVEVLDEPYPVTIDAWSSVIEVVREGFASGFPVDLPEEFGEVLGEALEFARVAARSPGAVVESRWGVSLRFEGWPTMDLPRPGSRWLPMLYPRWLRR